MKNTAKNKTKKDKRRHPRVPVDLSIDILAHGEASGKCRGTIADLSPSGMTFKSSAELEPGMCLYLKLNPSLEIRGEVRHSKGSTAGGMHRYGVLFHKISTN